MGQGDPPPNAQSQAESFNNTALFSDRQSSRASTEKFVDRTFTGKLDAYVYPEDLRGLDFARRGGQVMVFKIFDRKSQKIDLVQDIKNTFTIAKKAGGALLESIDFDGEAAGDLAQDEEFNTASNQLFGSDIVQASQENVDINSRDSAIAASFRQNSEQARFGKATEELKDQVILYVPKGIVFDNSVEYEDASMAGLSALTQAIASGFNNTAALTSTLGLQALKMAGSVTKNIGVDLEGGLKARAGFATNPKNELNFKGPTRNDFSFEFEFAPRSEKEAKTALEIIDIFRYYMSPEISLSSTVYFSPQEFDVSVVNLISETSRQGEEVFTALENTKMPKIGRCYLKNVKVDYTPDDRSAFFQNGQPTRIIMSLTFNQINYITKQGILAGF